MTPLLERPQAESTLKQVQRDIEGNLSPALKEGYLKIVVAGMRLMFSDATHRFMADYMKKITTPEMAPKMIAHGILKVISVLHRESQGKLSQKAAIPAAAMLATYALEFLGKRLPLTPEMVKETGRLVLAGIATLFKSDQTRPTQPLTPAVVPQGGA